MAECSDKIGMKEQCENHAKCMEMIQAVLDGSATSEEIEHFKSNLEVCKPCIEGYELEKTIKESLKTKIEKICCPQATINMLKLKVGIALLILVSTILEIKIIQHIILS